MSMRQVGPNDVLEIKCEQHGSSGANGCQNTPTETFGVRIENFSVQGDVAMSYQVSFWKFKMFSVSSTLRI